MGVAVSSTNHVQHRTHETTYIASGAQVPKHLVKVELMRFGKLGQVNLHPGSHNRR